MLYYFKSFKPTIAIKYIRVCVSENQYENSLTCHLCFWCIHNLCCIKISCLKICITSLLMNGNKVSFDKQSTVTSHSLTSGVGEARASMSFLWSTWGWEYEYRIWNLSSVINVQQPIPGTEGFYFWYLGT